MFEGSDFSGLVIVETACNFMKFCNNSIKDNVKNMNLESCQ